MGQKWYICEILHGNQVINQMNTNDKELYEAPSMLVFEVRQEGVICTSDPLGAGGFPEWPGESI